MGVDLSAGGDLGAPARAEQLLAVGTVLQLAYETSLDHSERLSVRAQHAEQVRSATGSWP